jgi:hypothetical protein
MSVMNSNEGLKTPRSNCGDYIYYPQNRKVHQMNKYFCGFQRLLDKVRKNKENPNSYYLLDLVLPPGKPFFLSRTAFIYQLMRLLKIICHLFLSCVSKEGGGHVKVNYDTKIAL